MSSKDLAGLFYMLEAAEKAAHLIKDRKRSDLETDEMLILALTRLLEIIGEAANGISSEIQRENPQIPWRQMVSARNHFIHGYFDVDHEIIWQIIQSDLPPVIADLKKLIEQEK